MHYRIVDKIGEGGMGEVYRAEDSNLGRQVAIKMLPETLTADPERLARFEREAQVLASLNHPNIAGIHSIEDADGRRFLVMELVEGEDLAAGSAHDPVPLAEALRIALQVTRGLEAATRPAPTFEALNCHPMSASWSLERLTDRCGGTICPGVRGPRSRQVPCCCRYGQPGRPMERCS